jgi:hypothetical protein
MLPCQEKLHANDVMVDRSRRLQKTQAAGHPAIPQPSGNITPERLGICGRRRPRSITVA